MWLNDVRRAQRPKLFVEQLDFVQAVVQDLKESLETMAHNLQIPEGGSCEAHLVCLCGNHMIPTVAHKSDILELHWSLFVSWMAGWMWQGGRTREHHKMGMAKMGNHTLAVEKSACWVARKECICAVNFLHYSLMLPKCQLALLRATQPTGWSHIGSIHWRSVCWRCMWTQCCCR